MPARQSAGDMIRSVSYAANIVGGAALQLSYTAIWPLHCTVFSDSPDDSRKTLLTLDVPLASASSYHTIDMKRILRGTLDRRPRHSNVQHANKSPPPPPPPPPYWDEGT